MPSFNDFLSGVSSSVGTLQNAATAPAANPFFTEETTRRDPSSYVVDAAAQYHAQQNEDKAKIGAAKQGIGPDQFDADKKKAADEEAQAKLNHELVMSTLDMPDDEWKKLMGQISSEVANRPVRPQPVAPGAPNPWLSLATAAAGVADPKRAAQYGAIPWNAKLQEAAQQTAEQNQRYEDQIATHKEQLQFLLSRADDQTKRDLAEFEAQSRTKDRLAGIQSQQMIAEENRRSREDTAKFNRYYTANIPGEKRAAWSAIKDLPGAPSQAQMESDVYTLGQPQRDKALAEWGKTLDRYAKWGEVDDKDIPSLKAKRAEIARAYSEYGVTEAMLGDFKTGKTIRAELAQAQLDTIRAKLPYVAEKARVDLSKAVAEKMAIRRRLDQADQRIAQGDRSIANAEYNAELRRYELATKAVNGKAEQQIQALNQKRAGVQAQLNKAGFGTDKAKLQSQLTNIDAQIQFLQDNKSEQAPQTVMPPQPLSGGFTPVLAGNIGPKPVRGKPAPPPKTLKLSSGNTLTVR